jgi:hypothetical protein
MPLANMTRKNVQLLTASWSAPLMPWPLVQPSASRAPKMMTTPPMKAAIMRLPTEGPKRSRQMAGTLSSLKLPLTTALTSAPRSEPSTNKLP